MRLVDLDAKEPYVLDGRYVVNVMSLKPHVHFDYDAIREEIEKKMTHGHWIWNEDEWNYQCSVCKEKFDYSKTYELFDHGFQMADYCPCCGAKMEGVKEV